MINYIFQIGIIYIVFSIIWAFFMLLYNMLTAFNTAASAWQTFLLRAVKTYFLISIVAIFTISYMHVPTHSAPLIATVGLLTLYSYMVGRLQQQRMMIQINHRMGNFKAPQTDMRAELLLLVAGLVYFTVCLYNPQLPDNSANRWFFGAVKDIYDTPVIGWIIGFFGILFLLATLVRAIWATMMLLQKLQDFLSGRNRSNGNNSDNDGEYTDYEEID